MCSMPIDRRTMSSDTPRFGKLVGSQLPVCGRRRMTSEGLAVADVDQSRHQFQRILEFRPAGTATLDAEGKDAGGTTAHVLLH